MMISTKGRYALRMLVDMAEHERGNTYVPLKEIAARQEISEKYLESIVKLLVQNNVLIGVRGKGGAIGSTVRRISLPSAKFWKSRKASLRPSPASANRMSRAPAW